MSLFGLTSHNVEMTNRDALITSVMALPLLAFAPVSLVALWYAGKNSFNAAESHPWLPPISDVALAVLYTVSLPALTHSGVTLTATPLWIGLIVDLFGLATTIALAAWEIRCMIADEVTLRDYPNVYITQPRDETVWGRLSPWV